MEQELYGNGHVLVWQLLEEWPDGKREVQLMTDSSAGYSTAGTAAKKKEAPPER